ncbi:MAG: hypothetical protein WDO15_11320 [Bacteroidota bacterium]
MKAIRYYQTMAINSDNTLQLFSLPGHEENPYFDSFEEAENAIHESYEDAQDTDKHPPEDKQDVVLTIVPVYVCRVKEKKKERGSNVQHK